MRIFLQRKEERTNGWMETRKGGRKGKELMVAVGLREPRKARLMRRCRHSRLTLPGCRGPSPCPATVGCSRALRQSLAGRGSCQAKSVLLCCNLLGPIRILKYSTREKMPTDLSCPPAGSPIPPSEVQGRIPTGSLLWGAPSAFSQQVA